MLVFSSSYFIVDFIKHISGIRLCITTIPSITSLLVSLETCPSLICWSFMRNLATFFTRMAHLFNPSDDHIFQFPCVCSTGRCHVLHKPPTVFFNYIATNIDITLCHSVINIKGSKPILRADLGSRLFRMFFPRHETVYIGNTGIDLIACRAPNPVWP